VGELCGCTEDLQEAHGDEIGGLQGITQVTILSHRLKRGTTHEVEARSARIHL